MAIGQQSQLLLEITGVMPSDQQLIQTRTICEAWYQVLQQCHEYIAANKPRYGLQACEFLNPGVIVGTDSWTVYFDTEIENESVVGVEFSDNVPSQLVIGD